MGNELSIYHVVITDIKGIISAGQKNAYHAASKAMVLTYWNVGKRIVEQEQKGNVRAKYGIPLIEELADELTKDFGKSYSKNAIFIIFANFIYIFQMKRL